MTNQHLFNLLAGFSIIILNIRLLPSLDNLTRVFLILATIGISIIIVYNSLVNAKKRMKGGNRRCLKN